MSLLSPWWLLSLIALPIMAALYFLKVRPRRQATNAFFLWEQIYQQNSSRALFKRLRDLWSLLLMLLVLALLAFAMAEPVIETDDSRDLIIVVDASASMQAQTGHGTRMELAQAEAERWIRNLDGQRQAAVASISDGLHFHSHSAQPLTISLALSGLATPATRSARFPIRNYMRHSRMHFYFLP